MLTAPQSPAAHLPAAQHGPVMRIIPSSELLGPEPATLTPREGQPALLSTPPIYPAAQFDTRWGVHSFSSIVRDLHQPSTADPSDDDDDNAAPAPRLHTPRPADDEAIPPSDDTPAPEPDSSAALPPALHFPPPPQPDAHGHTTRAALHQHWAEHIQRTTWHQLPRGPQAGNFIHEQLQWLAQEGFERLPPIPGPRPPAPGPHSDPHLPERILRRCERAGWAAEHAHAATAWLWCIARHRLPPLGAGLHELPQRGLPELEFWLNAPRLPSATLDALCRAHILRGQARPALTHSHHHGLLMGFADLVFEHRGRYWVLDYKTNHLGDGASAYTSAALAAAMLRHRYDVQAALYLLALHHLLTQRLGAHYHPAQHLGGAVYYFVRGIDGPAQGCHTIAADAPILTLLDELQNLIAPGNP